MEAAPVDSVRAGRRHTERKQPRTLPAQSVTEMCGHCAGPVRPDGASARVTASYLHVSHGPDTTCA